MRTARDTQVQPTIANYTFPNLAAHPSAKSGADPKAYLNLHPITDRDPTMSYNSLFSGAYAQDTWKPLGNVTLTYGLRYDLFSPPSANENSPFPPTRAASERTRTIWLRASGSRSGSGKNRLRRRAAGSSMILFTMAPVLARPAQQRESPVFCRQPPRAAAVCALRKKRAADEYSGLAGDYAGHHHRQPRFCDTVLGQCERLRQSRAIVESGRDCDLPLHSRNRLPAYRNINLVPSG